MLTFFRNKMKLIFAILLVGIIPAFTLWGIGSILRAPKTTIMGEINGREVSYPEYRTAQLAVLWDALLSNRTLEPDEANDATWNRLILLDVARDYGIVVSDEEVAARITKLFQRGGRFDRQFYLDILRHNRITPAAYEEATRNSIKIERLRDLILDGVKMTEQEFVEDYNRKNRQVIVDYVLFNFNDYQEKVTPTDEELLVYFEEHKDDYRKPNETNVKYVEVAIADFMPGIAVTEEEAKTYYEENIDQFTEEKQVHARHILFKVPETAGEDVIENVRARASEVLEKAKAGEDFAELAKEYSEGPTASNGGDLGFFGTGAMVKAFEDAAFATPAGQVYPELVKTRFGYHIIKVEEIQEEKVNEFEEIKQQVTEQLKTEKADRLAREAIQEIYYQSDALDTLQKAAQELGVDVKETGFFSSSYNIPGIGTSRDFHKAAFDLDLFNVSEIVETDDGYAVLSPVERQSGVLPEFTEVKDKLTRDYKAAKSTDLAKTDAQAARSKIMSLMESKNLSFEDAAKEAGLDVQTTPPFTMTAPDPAIGYGYDLGNTLFSLSVNEVSEPIDTGRGIAIVRPVEYIEANISELPENEREQLKQQLSFQKKYMVFQEWFEGTKKNAQLIDMTAYRREQSEE